MQKEKQTYEMNCGTVIKNNINVIRIPEEKYWGNNGWEFSKINDIHQIADPGASNNIK